VENLGGKHVPFAMAFDPRVKAGVSSHRDKDLRFLDWQKIWYLGSKIPREF
jgi:hypothetical protein